MDSDELGPLDIPGVAGHHVDGVCATDADGDHSEATGVGGVAVGADHHPAGEGVLLKYDLMDDSRTRLPEPGSVARTHGLQKVVDLGVVVNGYEQVRCGVKSGRDEVVAVGGGGDLNLVEACGHELKPRHLGGCVLHCDTVGSQVNVGAATFEA